MAMGSPNDVLQAMREATAIVVSSQSPLDGDSVGSELALLHLAPQLAPGATLRAINESPPPQLYGFLPGIDRMEVLGPADTPPPADLLIVLDCGDLDRFDYLPSRFTDAKIVNLDHHQSNTGFGDVHWVAETLASTGEQVAAIAELAGATLDRAAAEALYAAIVFDTGRFAYSNTSAATLRIAATLLDAGVRPEAMYRELFRSRSEASLRLMGLALSRIQYAPDRDAAWVAIRTADLDRAGGGYEDLEDLVNLPMSLRGMEVSLLFKELPDGRAKVSLRSDRWFDVAAFARGYGGGGHVRAAGMTVPGPLDRSVAEVSAALVARMAETRPATVG